MKKIPSFRSPSKRAREGCRVWALMVLCLFSLVSACRNNTTSLPITVFTGEWIPYISKFPDGVSGGEGGAYGVTSEVVTAALREMNYEPDYQFRQWSELENLLLKKNIHSAFPYRKTASREHSFCFSKPIGESVEVLFYNKNSLSDDLETAAESRLGVVEGYEYGQEIYQTFSNRVTFISETDAFNALIDEKIDVLPADKHVGMRLLEKHFLLEKHRIGILSDFENHDTLHLIVPSKGVRDSVEGCDIEFLETFDEALQTISERGVVANIKNRYSTQFELDRKIKLTPSADYPLVFGVTEEYQEADVFQADVPKIIIPKGTQAIVIQWHDFFTRASTFEIMHGAENKTLVRISEGPLKDRMLLVPNIFVTAMGQ